MTMLTATLTAISLYYRAFWAFAVLLILIMAALLLMINYHFLSDVIAGTYLGLALAILLKHVIDNKT